MSNQNPHKYFSNTSVQNWAYNVRKKYFSIPDIEYLSFLMLVHEWFIPYFIFSKYTLKLVEKKK